MSSNIRFNNGFLSLDPNMLLVQWIQLLDLYNHQGEEIINEVNQRCPHQYGLAIKWDDELIGPYSSEEHKLYSEAIETRDYCNIIAKCFKIEVSRSKDLDFGALLCLIGGRTGCLATSSMLVVGSKNHDNMGRVGWPLVLGISCLGSKISKKLKRKRSVEQDIGKCVAPSE